MTYHLQTVVFQSNIFHPLVHPETRILNTSWGFPEWKKTTRISLLVKYITKVLTKLDSKMPAVNEEASLLWVHLLVWFRASLIPFLSFQTGDKFRAFSWKSEAMCQGESESSVWQYIERWWSTLHHIHSIPTRDTR